jgi:hypothetical protein
MTTGLMYPKGTPTCLRKAAIAKEAEKAWRLCKARVRRRDGGRCRYCGKPGLPDPHHILARSLGGRDIDENILCLCREHHDWVKPRLLVITGNAECMVRMDVDERVSRSGKPETWFR